MKKIMKSDFKEKHTFRFPEDVDKQDYYLSKAMTKRDNIIVVEKYKKDAIPEKIAKAGFWIEEKI